MTRYRLSCTIDDAYKDPVLDAVTDASLRAELNPEITLSLMFNEPSPSPRPPAAAEVIHAMHPEPPAKRVVKRATRGNGEWPAPGSIYDIVLQAIQSEPKTNAALSEILKNSGKSPDSLGSATARLKKANRAKFGEGGWIAT